jgi:endonuclease/exonuclease/phosphatase family metal-dependent hydrolase
LAVLRCLTLNLWGDQPPLEARVQLVLQGIAALKPDLVALQEVCEFPELPNQAETLARASGLSFVFASAVAFRGGREGLALLARPPLAIVAHESRELPGATTNERRVVQTAGLSVGDRVIWVHNTHLNYRLTHGRQREEQVMAIDRVVAARPDEPQIVLGDFNARPESDEIRWLTGLTTLEGRRTFYQDAWARRHPAEPGWTWASANPYTTALGFLQTDRRLDYIFVTPERRDGRGRILDCRLVFDQPAPGGVYASDHFGLLADVQVTAGPSSPPATS